MTTGHAPQIAQDRSMITGCRCGWRTPPGTTDSDDAFATHVANGDIHRKVERVPMTKSAFNGVQVFSATMVAQRQELGEKVTRWIEEAKRMRPGFQIVDIVVSQSSDDEFHCIAINLFFREDVRVTPRRRVP